MHTFFVGESGCGKSTISTVLTGKNKGYEGKVTIGGKELKLIDEELWEVLDRVNLLEFLKSEKGLDTKLNEKATNLSGGQCQRLALARALLHDSPIYFFDEATSNIDVESENDIMSVIYGLAGSKTGNHEELLNNNGMYAKLWNTQQNLENYGKEGAIA